MKAYNYTYHQIQKVKEQQAKTTGNPSIKVYSGNGHSTNQIDISVYQLQ